MIEFNKTTKIAIGAAFFLLLILLGVTFINPPKYSFKKPLKEVLAEISTEAYSLNPQQLAKFIAGKDQNILLVDVRSQYEYAKSHLPEAKNIPTTQLLEGDNYKYFKDADRGNKQVVLYGNTANDASAPFMILHQMGFDNIRYTQAGYQYFEGKDIKEVAQEKFIDVDEKPVADFAQFVEEAVKKVETSEVSKVEVVMPKKKPVTIKVQPNTNTEEDEGC